MLTRVVAAGVVNATVDKKSRNAPAPDWVLNIGNNLGYHIFECVWVALAHALSPLKEIVVLPPDGKWPDPPEPTSPEASANYYVAGWLVVCVKLFITELESRKNLSARLKRLHDTMKKWAPHVQMTQEEAEKLSYLSTGKASRKSAEKGALQAVFVGDQMNTLVIHLEHTVKRATESGALHMQGAVDLFTRIENVLIYDKHFLRLFMLTFKSMADPSTDEVALVKHVAPIDIPENIVDILDCIVWVHGQVAHDFWRFIINKYIRMRGQDLIKKINDQRTAKDKDTDSGSLRSNLARRWGQIAKRRDKG